MDHAPPPPRPSAGPEAGPSQDWPAFLRLLRDPRATRAWLEEAAELPDLQKRPMLLRWIAQHRHCPEALRNRLLTRLPWRALAAIVEDASAHPKARAVCTERLQVLWAGMSLGERRSFAPHAPRAMWPQVWRIRDAGVLRAFLAHPRLGLEPLCGLLQPPLLPQQAEALLASPWRTSLPVAHQVLQAMDRSFQLEACPLVLGHAAPWIKDLEPGQRLLAAARMAHPPLRRMTRAWAAPDSEREREREDPDPGRPADPGEDSGTPEA